MEINGKRLDIINLHQSPFIPINLHEDLWTIIKPH